MSKGWWKSIKNNISLPILKKLSNYGIISKKSENNIYSKYSRDLGIKAINGNVISKTLSGGNRQKVVLAKWLATNPSILIMNNPTRGIDVGVKSEVYELMRKLSVSGIAILLFSDELPELIGMSDRIFIMRDKEISAFFDNYTHNLSEKEIIKYMI